MNTTKFFGQILSEKIGKKEIACSGILRLAIKDGGKNPDSINVNDLQTIFRTTLKTRLENVGIDNPNDVAKHMLSQLTKNHALFVMSA